MPLSNWLICLCRRKIPAILLYLHVCRWKVFAMCWVMARQSSTYTSVLNLALLLRWKIFTILILRRKRKPRCIKQSRWWCFTLLIWLKRGVILSCGQKVSSADLSWFWTRPIRQVDYTPLAEKIMIYRSVSVQVISGSEQLVHTMQWVHYKCHKAGWFHWEGEIPQLLLGVQCSAVLVAPTAFGEPWEGPALVENLPWEGAALLENLSIQRLNVCSETQHSNRFTKSQNSK